MIEIDDRIRGLMERALEEACRQLPHGGSHEMRKFIADRLLERASAGRATLGEFGILARKALATYRDIGQTESVPNSAA